MPRTKTSQTPTPTRKNAGAGRNQRTRGVRRASPSTTPRQIAIRTSPPGTMPCSPVPTSTRPSSLPSPSELTAGRRSQVRQDSATSPPRRPCPTPSQPSLRTSSPSASVCSSCSLHFRSEGDARPMRTGLHQRFSRALHRTVSMQNRRREESIGRSSRDSIRALMRSMAEMGLGQILKGAVVVSRSFSIPPAGQLRHSRR